MVRSLAAASLLCLLVAFPFVVSARQFHGRKLACSDNRADCTAWGPGLCTDYGVRTLCPCMCGGGTSAPTPAPTAAPTPRPVAPTSGCNDNRADCTAWGPGLCSDNGVRTLCPCMCGGGTSAPTPAPTAKPTPRPVTPAPTPAQTGQVAGYWYKTWDPASNTVPANTNLGIAFSGWANVNNAVSESSAVYNNLPGTKYIDLGGGDSSGRWSQSVLNSVTAAINAGTFSAYAGIVYDVEEGDAGLASAFATSFAAAKAKGFKVLVTVSNSCPYGFNDAGSLMRSFFSNGNIDYLSPQLYESGEEAANVYGVCDGGVQWSEWASSRASVIPSIVYASYYSGAQSRFRGWGVTTAGYIQWH